MYAPTYRPGPLFPDERETLQITADMLLRRSDPAAVQIGHSLNSIADGASTAVYEQVAAQIREYMHETARRADPEFWMAQADTSEYALGTDMIQVWVAENVAATMQLRDAVNILATAKQRLAPKTPVTV